MEKVICWTITGVVFFQACHDLKRLFNPIKHTIYPKIIITKKGKTRENTFLCLCAGLHCPSILLVSPRFERSICNCGFFPGVSPLCDLHVTHVS